MWDMKKADEHLTEYNLSYISDIISIYIEN